VVGDPYATTPGGFRGYSDPHLVADPDDADRIWLSYSWLETGPLTDPTGREVAAAIVINHLARSDDGGATFERVATLWDSIGSADPEGSGEEGLIDSETASLAWIRDPAGEVTWYGAHIRYFLRPAFGYQPNYGTSFTIRVTAADRPEALTDSPETVLGTRATADAWDADVALDALSGLDDVRDCGFVNNPSLFAEDQTLYLVFECLAFRAGAVAPEHTTIQLVATEPAGAPETWTWRHVGRLADGDTFAELGVDLLQQPDLARGSDGAILFTVTPGGDDPDSVAPLHDGFLVLELASLDPPRLARGCDGGLRVRARMPTPTLGGCTYAAESATGVLCHSLQTMTEPRHLWISGVHP